MTITGDREICQGPQTSQGSRVCLRNIETMHLDWLSFNKQEQGSPCWQTSKEHPRFHENAWLSCHPHMLGVIGCVGPLRKCIGAAAGMKQDKE